MNIFMQVLKLFVAIVVSHSAGLIGAIATADSVRTWYSTIRKPSFNPPGWIFMPVWIILYTLMGIAAWLVWRKGFDNNAVRVALVLFVIQLVLNSLWSWIFFGWHQPLWAFVEIIILWVAILLTTIWFFRVSTLAGMLMIPYILWVSFASVLNFAVWWLNRG